MSQDRLPRVQLDRVVLVCAAACAAILGATAVVAWFSPPNSADAMAYHTCRASFTGAAGQRAIFRNAVPEPDAAALTE